MGKMGGFYAADIKQLQKDLSKLNQNADRFIQDCARELAARLLAGLLELTPESEAGGTLRRGWTAQQHVSASGAAGYVESLTINHFDDTYIIEIINPVEYASYVEYGHRKRGGKGWVKGQFFMQIAEAEVDRAAPAILERKIKEYLGGVFS